MATWKIVIGKILVNSKTYCILNREYLGNYKYLILQGDHCNVHMFRYSNIFAIPILSHARHETLWNLVHPTHTHIPKLLGQKQFQETRYVLASLPGLKMSSNHNLYNKNLMFMFTRYVKLLLYNGITKKSHILIKIVPLLAFI